MSNFRMFKDAVTAKFATMSSQQLYCTTAEPDVMWDTYLDSFPAGTNKVFRQRREFDCSCCRQFIRAMGNVVAIVDNKKISIWDIEIDDPTFKVVASELAKQAKLKPIEKVFLHWDDKVGTDSNKEFNDNEILPGALNHILWEHFYLKLSGQNTNVKHWEKDPAQIGPKISEKSGTFEVLNGGLEKIKLTAIDDVVDLIKENNLYKGAEYLDRIVEFRKVLVKYNALIKSEPAQSTIRNFVWSQTEQLHIGVCRLKNSSMGTLLVELSEGIDLEKAVANYEKMVAPENYRRSTALVSESMVKKAQAELIKLGLVESLQRRFATLQDVSVNNVIYADRSARKKMKDNVFDGLANRPASVKAINNNATIAIEDFITEVVPQATSMEVLFENKNVNNLTSLIAPMSFTDPNLFAWNNPFSWSYKGDVTDSIKEKVKRAGGNVSADLCCRLAWSNFDDLDLHMVEPNGNEIFFMRRTSPYTMGQLDVDMNANSGKTREPVENIFYPDSKRMLPGKYTLYVQQYHKRENVDVGFDIEIAAGEQTYKYNYPKAVLQGQNVVVAELIVDHANNLTINSLIPESAKSQKKQDVWGISTGEFHKVSLLTLSPNFWDNQKAGHKHYLFMLADCKSDESARGFFVEYLKPELIPHRKVLEVVGSKTKIHDIVDPLSGLGFSSTKSDVVVVKIKTADDKTRQYNVEIA